jgi:ABC-type dipeptide/oligopeptide/nickel transport system ATPase component
MASLPNRGVPLLEARNLRVTYQTQGQPCLTAARDIDLHIGHGEILGVLGESGCGKSSVGMALLRLLPPAGRQTGEILFRGQDLASLNEGEMRKIRGAQLSMIFQDPVLSLNPLMRVGDQIGELLLAHRDRTHKQRREIVLDLLGQLEMGDVDRIYRSYPHQLSGGQCQRILIAQSLICKPTLIIADEPTASLDAVTALEIIKLIRRINQQDSIAFLMISHDPAVLGAVAHRIAVMYAGEIVEQGPVDEILTEPHHPYTQALLAAGQHLPQPA